jgi:hypothetical protein
MFIVEEVAQLEKDGESVEAAAEAVVGYKFWEKVYFQP